MEPARYSSVRGLATQLLSAVVKARRASTGFHIDDAEALGQRLRSARQRAGMSQRDLAFPGCSFAYVHQIEAGRRIPSLQVIRELGRRLGVSERYLARGEDASEARAIEWSDTKLAVRMCRTVGFYEATEVYVVPVRLAELWLRDGTAVEVAGL